MEAIAPALSSRKKIKLNKVAIAALFLTTATFHMVSAQIIRTGLTVGGQWGWTHMENSSFKDTVKTSAGIGFKAGVVVSFKVKNRYFLHTEYVYSTKSKFSTGKIDPLLKDKTTYHYFEIPLLFSMHFKGKVGEGKNFKWYAGVGPNVAYLLAGGGKIESSELIENGIPSLRYKIKFGTRTDRDHNEHIHYTKVNRLQFGINVGGGILLEPIPKHKVMMDVRYTVDQTLFGKSTADYLVPHDYDDNLQFRNKGIRISFMYLLEYNLNKVERNKGKSISKE